MLRQGRPVFLNLFQIRMPPPAVLSILHRASGMALVLVLPLLLWLFDLSLSGEAGFARVREWLHGGFARLLLFLFAWGVIHHLLSGIRFLLIDFDIGVNRAAARKGAWMVMGSAFASALLVGVML
jgi:succinate dehydrogenase / fumarate reductase, cytochrome b subunit